MKVTVIIPNYNGFAFMQSCMKALESQTYKEFEIVVVDNGSTDESIPFLKDNYSSVKLILMGENTGFCGAVNVGIKAAETPYIILLNNDTVVHQHYIGELVRSIEKSDRIFSVSPKMIQLHHKELMDDAGDMYTILGWAFQRGVGHSSSGYVKSCKVFSACAGAAIYRREIFEEIGYFDEIHFAYLEDMDVGYRAKIAGYDNIYCPNSIVYHVGSGTSGSKYNSFKVRLAARNSVYLIYKNMPLLQLIINLPALMIGYVVKYQFFRKIGFAKDYRNGLREGLGTITKCKKVKFKLSHISNYIMIELELICGTFVYTYEFVKRKLMN